MADEPGLVSDDELRAHASEVAPASQRRFRYRMGGGRLFQVLWALCAIAMVRQSGVLTGILDGLVAAGLLWAVIWTAWLITEAGAVSRAIRATPTWAVVTFCVIAVPAVWALDPDGAFPDRSGALLWFPLLAEWFVIAFAPVVAARWYTLRTHRTGSRDATIVQ